MTLGHDLQGMSFLMALLAFPTLYGLAHAMHGRLRRSITFCLCLLLTLSVMFGAVALIIWKVAPGRVRVDGRSLQEYRIDLLAEALLSPALGGVVAGLALCTTAAAVQAAAAVRKNAENDQAADRSTAIRPR